MTKPGIYRHNKTGNMYEVLGTVTVATNGEQNGKKMVLYEPSPQHGDDQFVRDEAEFNEPGRFTFWTELS